MEFAQKSGKLPILRSLVVRIMPKAFSILFFTIALSRSYVVDVGNIDNPNPVEHEALVSGWGESERLKCGAIVRPVVEVATVRIPLSKSASENEICIAGVFPQSTVTISANGKRVFTETFKDEGYRTLRGRWRRTGEPHELTLRISAKSFPSGRKCKVKIESQFALCLKRGWASYPSTWLCFMNLAFPSTGLTNFFSRNFQDSCEKCKR